MYNVISDRPGEVLRKLDELESNGVKVEILASKFEHSHSMVVFYHYDIEVPKNKAEELKEEAPKTNLNKPSGKTGKSATTAPTK